MKEVLENLHQICSTLNDKFNGKLLDYEKLDDFLEDIRDDWDSSFEQLKCGLQILESQAGSIESSRNSAYTKGILEIFWGLRRLEVLLDDADDLLVTLNKKLMYESGEISEEEYLDDGILNVKYLDEDNDSD
ncbi:hypothetical protein [Streptococcus cristatus]|uniref:Uncharacterized protein n=1 Tax=Streptococcus cristatus TaxID=45634 RepID=A0A428H8K1_STRCR|nr:hypothetical protein [Streptococcus cristatus]RSJ92077.1 hypothetical protein D8792_02385 [Streptococcus cristatus]